MVNTSGFHRVNQFCVVGYSPNGSHVATPYIYWPTQNKIATWEVDPDQPVLDFLTYFDLNKDILPDGEVTYNYLHHSDLKRIIQDCKKYGDSYKIKKTEDGWVAINRYSKFSDILEHLQYLANQTSSPNINKFCVIGQKDGAFVAAYVYWETQNQLIFWYPGRYDNLEPYALANPAFEVDLTSGLKDQESYKEYKNEMQRSYAEGILKACQKRGKEYVIKKSN